MKIQLIAISLLTFSCFACNQEKKIEGFDDKVWREDHNACSNNRYNLVKILLSKKDALKEFDDDAVSTLLGPPERNRQFARGKKNYIYFMYPGSQCPGDTSKNEGKKLVIEFDALGKPRIIRESFIDY